MQHCLHLKPCLAIGLGLEAKRQANLDASQREKFLPKGQGKLELLVLNHVNRDIVEVKCIVHHQVGSLVR